MTETTKKRLGPYQKEKELRESLGKGEYLLYLVRFLKNKDYEQYSTWKEVSTRIQQVKRESGFNSVLDDARVYVLKADGFSRQHIANANQGSIWTLKEEEEKIKKTSERLKSNEISEERKKYLEEKSMERFLDTLDYYGKKNYGSATRFAARQHRKKYEREDEFEDDEQ